MNNDERRTRLRRLVNERNARAAGGAGPLVNNVTRMSNANLAREIANIEAVLPRRLRIRRSSAPKRSRRERAKEKAGRLEQRLANRMENLENPFQSQYALRRWQNEINYYRNFAAAPSPSPRRRKPKRRRPSLSPRPSATNNSGNNIMGVPSPTKHTLLATRTVRRRRGAYNRGATSAASNSNSSPRRRRGESVGSRSQSSSGNRTPFENSNNSVGKRGSRKS
jgi:hypothetical protein